jgi:hypothetical protein
MAFRARVFGVSCFALVLSAFLLSSCGSSGSLAADKERVAQLLTQNSQMRDFLENDLYEISGNLLITTVSSYDGPEPAILLRDGKLYIPAGYDNGAYVESHEQQILAVFKTFHCVSIGIQTDDYGLGMRKVLGILLGSIKNGGRYYTQSIGYSRDGAIDAMGKSIFTNWFYWAQMGV